MKGTDEIRTYSFDNDGLNELKSFEYGKNWPVVYLIHNNKDLYIGETTSAEVRMSQHLSNNEKNYLEEIAIVFDHKFNKTSVYKGYKRDKIEMRVDRVEVSDFPLYLNTVAGGLDRRDQTIGGFSFVVKIYAVPVVEIIGQLLYLLGRYGFNTQFGDCL